MSHWVYPTASDLLAVLSKMDDGAAHRGYDVLLEGGKVSDHLVNHWPDNGLKVLTRSGLSLERLAPRPGDARRVEEGGRRPHLRRRQAAGDRRRPTTPSATRRTRTSHSTSAVAARRCLQGKLDDVQLYGLALTAENAAQLAAGQAPDLADTLLAVPAEKLTPTQVAQVRRFYLDRIDAEYAQAQD